MEQELWITALFNDHLSGLANSVLAAAGLPASDRPWSDWLVCELLVVAFMLVLFGVARTQLSVEKPGRLQHTLEVVYEFLSAQGEEAIGHGSEKYMGFFATMFFFILFMNLIGLIPGFESPTMYTVVPAGLAIATFFYYHATGLKSNGLGYFKQFLGPIWWLAVVMLPIELVSHFARPLSLTIRLYANMFAGEQVFLTFLGLTKLFIPAIFIGLHLFVGVLQAYIFTLLGMIYVGGAVAHEH